MTCNMNKIITFYVKIFIYHFLEPFNRENEIILFENSQFLAWYTVIGI